MTGSKAQLYNGICLLTTFFSCRLIWGNIQSAFVYRDMWRAVHQGPSMPFATETPANASIAYGNEDIMVFAKDAGPIPVWLALIYVASNLTLNTLNVHWFLKMIKAVRKRFEPPKEEVEKKTEEKAEPQPEPVLKHTATGFEAFTEEVRRRERALSESIPAIEDDLGEMQ